MQWKEKVINQVYSVQRFIRFVIKHFIQDDCTYIASALAFTSILAIVPLISVGLAIFSSFPMFQDFLAPLQNFIFENFIPATGKIVQNYILQFASQVSKLSVTGIIFLLGTVLLMMFTIEQAMNKIWRVNTSRHGAPAFLLYWAILSLAPILLGLSIAASSYLLSLPFLKEHSSAPSFLMHYSTFFLSFAGFMFLYSIVPNCPVKIRAAFGGSLVSALLFELAKGAFSYYLTRFQTYELLYGAFASVPIFFIWVYWVWLITLLGAEISYALSVHHQRRNGQPLDGFSHALLWLHELWLGQQTGKGLSFDHLINVSKQPFAIDAEEMINTLMQHELIHTTAEGQYMLSRDLSSVSLYQLTQLLPYRLPTHWELQYAQSSLAKQWKTTFKKNDEELRKTLDISLESLFSN